MPKPTLTTRVTHLEEHTHTCIEAIAGFKQWLGNGFTDDVSVAVTKMMGEKQEKEWEHHMQEQRLELDRQRVANASKGDERDALMKKKDRNTKMMIGVVPVATVIVTYFLTRGG